MPKIILPIFMAIVFASVSGQSVSAEESSIGSRSPWMVLVVTDSPDSSRVAATACPGGMAASVWTVDTDGDLAQVSGNLSVGEGALVRCD